MADQKKWFKVWSTILIDPHHMNLSLTDVGRWTRLGAMIVSTGEAGTLKIIPPAKSFLMAMNYDNLDDAKRALSTLPNVAIEECKSDNGSFTVIMKNWFKYQVDSTAYQRLKRSRYKRRGEEKRSRGEQEEIPPTPHAPRFSKPTPEEVTSYARSISFRLDGQSFCDYYESKGWVVGKSPMKNWRAAVRTWKGNGYSGGSALPPAPKPYKDPAKDIKPEDLMSAEEVRQIVVAAGLGKSMS